jgi:hypothetical protein
MVTSWVAEIVLCDDAACFLLRHRRLRAAGRRAGPQRVIGGFGCIAAVLEGDTPVIGG